jgi:quinol monooxygenase YgiN
MAIVLQATWTLKPGSEAAVLGALETLASESRAEPGCRLYQPYHDPDTPGVIHIFEIYDDEEALAAHGSSEHFKRLVVDEVIPLLENRERRYFETLDA